MYVPYGPKLFLRVNVRTCAHTRVCVRVMHACERNVSKHSLMVFQVCLKTQFMVNGDMLKGLYRNAHTHWNVLFFDIMCCILS